MDRAVTHLTVGEVERAVADRFPVERAESWDRVGLLVGDSERSVDGVVLALDPTSSAIAAAADLGANLLVTHHPAFLEPPDTFRRGPGPGGIVFTALDRGVALLNAHTNLDRDEAAQRLIPERLQLVPITAVESAAMPLAVITVYVPESHADLVRVAMADAGAGRIGDYRDCSFAADGTGRFTPDAAANPFLGDAGVPSTAPEVRLEMVCPRARSSKVIAAAAASHPYEQPLVTATDAVASRNGAALGMLSRPANGAALSLGELAERASTAYGVSARMWGDADRTVRRVASTTGSGGSLIPDARSAGADVLVAGEVRYHDALDAVDNGFAILELGHDVTEWPLVGLLEQTVRALPGLDASHVHVLTDRPRWQTVST